MTPTTPFTDALHGVGLVPLPAHVTPNATATPPFRPTTIEILGPGKQAVATALSLYGWQPTVDPSASEDGPTDRPITHTIRLTKSDTPSTSDGTLHITADRVADTAEEGYRLFTTPHTDGATLTSLHAHLDAATARGHFYAGITLGRLVATETLHPGCVIDDQPRFAHRALMVDVARSFLTVSELRDLVRAMSLIKLNTLHLHLVDDQGWRVEITNDGRDMGDRTDYTALHRLGGKTACNPGTNPGFDMPGLSEEELAAINSGFDAIGPGISGYYTQDELRSLVTYAAEHHVSIIPELEFPGHNHVVLYALPHLATENASVTDEGAGVEPWTRWQVGYSYLDFTNLHTWRFIRHILRQFATIFDTQRIHLGGDEAFKMLYTLGHELYDEVLHRIVTTAKDAGFEAVTVWQEGAAALNSPSDHTQVWNWGAQHQIERVITAGQRSGIGFIQSDARYAYLDQKVSPTDTLGLTWACPEGLPTRTTYEWDPVDTFPKPLRSRVVGIESCLWSETVRGGHDAAQLLFPRLCSLAEVAWTPQDRRHWEDFAQRTPQS